MNSPISYHRPVPKWALPLTQLVFAFTLVMIGYLSVRPATTSISIDNADKVMHMGAYFVLAALLALAAPRLKLFYVLLLPCLYGGLIEIAQGMMTTGRTGSIFDMVANILGAALAAGGWYVFAKFVLKRRA